MFSLCLRNLSNVHIKIQVNHTTVYRCRFCCYNHFTCTYIRLHMPHLDDLRRMSETKASLFKDVNILQGFSFSISWSIFPHALLHRNCALNYGVWQAGPFTGGVRNQFDNRREVHRRELGSIRACSRLVLVHRIYG
jgi:hypothetical protein